MDRTFHTRRPLDQYYLERLQTKDVARVIFRVLHFGQQGLPFHVEPVPRFNPFTKRFVVQRFERLLGEVLYEGTKRNRLSSLVGGHFHGFVAQPCKAIGRLGAEIYTNSDGSKHAQCDDA